MKLNLLVLFIFFLQASFKPAENPSFKGGASGLANFINQSMIYPEYSKQNCIEGTIEVSFRLNSQGRIIESKVQKGLGIDLDDEALRLIRLTSGKWTIPALYDTTSVITLPINFSLRQFNCWRSATEIKAAIDAYKAQGYLSDAVITYYEKKDKGNYTADDEQKIIQLKEELGYDDDYISRVIDQAKQKIKQGDQEGACKDLQFVRKIGSDKADKLIATYCK
ncbi:energy transducer TonB [Arcticibacter eurypsychrophilus]|uniref:energy transducer TonB n=1 Tax=Arcticibacter eurypsychrophilus TaxID=1434752 RepID=UPI00084D0359|nr:energy transducer TonB [Arcticibacter eurypsychrophilus]